MDKYAHEKTLDPDPDYASHNFAIKRAEKQKEENVNTVEKVIEVLNEEFSKELSQRQNQIEHIEKQIHKTQKLLHLLRYVLISSHYNRKDLEYNGSEETTAKADASYLFDQNRIHPALKKLLGKNTTPDFAMCRSARRNKVEHKPNLMVENLNDLSCKNSNNSCHKSPTSYTSQGTGTQQTSGIDRNRQKVKNRIIVGNISKWMPSYEDDNLTHKWMMYVRGPKENPDVSHFIEKVVFYLHPSYKPHDVVEVREPPFHLSRRGWGEFPIRVQIHFRCTLNKPVDIVHNLKLDKTYSGRQTLGNESIIDLYLYDDKITSIKTEDSHENLTVKVEKKEENKKHEIVAFTDICERSEFKQEQETEMQHEVVPNFEHDYCTEDSKMRDLDATQIKESLCFEHSYSYPPTHEFLNIETKTKSPENIEQEENTLIHGLDESYSETNEDSSKKEPLYYRKTSVYTTKQSTQSASTSQSRNKIISIKRKSQDSLLKKLFTSKFHSSLVMSTGTVGTNQKVRCDDVDKFIISLPKRADLNLTKFKNMGEVLPYLFKRLPLVSELAKDSKYKSLYPFTAVSLEEYSSWNIAKQSSAEWSRAKIVKNIVTKDQIHEHEKWNTKALMMYARSHGFTPKPNFSLSEKSTAENKLINNCFKSSIELPFNPSVYDKEQQVDVENETESPEKKRMKLSVIDISDSKIKTQCSFIREEALECGIVLKNETLEENIVFNGAERMIFEAVKCLANHLVRRSLHHSVSKSNSGESKSEINTSHVQKAIEERNELGALAIFKTKQEKIKYFFP